MENTLDADTRVAVVTGASRGIGRGCVEQLLDEGYLVYGIARPSSDLDALAQLGDAVRIVPADLCSIDDIEAAVRAIDGQVDVVVHSAGGNVEMGLPDPTSLTEMADFWRRNFELNVLSVVLLTEALRPCLNRGTRVITIGSIAGHVGADSYGASKAALRAWNVEMAESLGQALGGTANLVSPGLVLGTNFFRGALTQERTSLLVSKTLNGRAAQIHDVVSTCSLLWGVGGGHISGQTIHVNGGAFLQS